MLEQLVDRARLVLRMTEFMPQRTHPHRQPEIEFGEQGEPPLRCLLQDPPARILHVLLDDARLPARGHIAEVVVDQVVSAHRLEACVHQPALALANPIHGRLHVVVDAAPRHPSAGREAARARIERHLVALAGVRHQPERPACAKHQVHDLGPVEHAAHDCALLAPVERVRLAPLERPRHERHLGGSLAFPQGARRAKRPSRANSCPYSRNPATPSTRPAPCAARASDEARPQTTPAACDQCTA